MTRVERPLSPEARALLDREREIPPLPAAVRARALARAQAALTAGVVHRRFSSAPPARRMQWAAAAALVLLATGAAAAAYELGSRLFPATDAVPSTGAEPARSRPAAPVAPVSDGIPEVSAVDEGVRPTRAHAEPRLSRAEAMRAELRLLRHARSAVAREEFAAALTMIGEHARRFKDGRLAEEREALRVKALVGLGRADEARRAAAAFEARFPRSVLLPAIGQMSASGR